MAKLNFSFCVRAHGIENMLAQGRKEEALRSIIAILQTGAASPQCQALAAEMLTPKKSDGKRGPKVKKDPFKWYEIGQDYDQLRDDGVTDTEARLILAERYPRGKRTIDTIIAYYNKVMQAGRDFENEQFAAEQGRSRN